MSMNCQNIMESNETTEDKETRSDQQDSMKNNWMEQTKIPQVRAIVERQDPSSKEVDDLTIRRFLRARGLDIGKASSMLLRYLKWRREFVPNGSISLLETPNEVAQNKMFLQGSDKKGRPITVILGARHFQSKGGLEEFKRFVVYGFDKICSRMPPGQEKFVVIGDLEGWGYANSDIHGYLGGLTILQEYYPERLAKVFLVHVPYIFMAAWKIVHPFIDKNTRKKIVFVDNRKLKSTLLEEIDESQIPDIYGGVLPLIPIHESK
ncbi:phosphatidylinositol transfer protein [Salix suchowensis]|nr:phosphatidylinositol transfer protein [Salix suchowensis]